MIDAVHNVEAEKRTGLFILMRCYQHIHIVVLLKPYIREYQTPTITCKFYRVFFPKHHLRGFKEC